MPLVLHQPFALHTFVRCGSSVSVFGISRLGSSLALLDGACLGATVSLRSWNRLASSLSVLQFVQLGSTLALRSFLRHGSAMSLVDVIRLGSTLSVFDSFCLSPGKIVKLPGWTISYDASSQDMHFTKLDSGGNSRPLTIVPSGGNLHGTWSADSIISSSDRRLKRKVVPLQHTLHVGRRTPKQARASRLLRELHPRRVAVASGEAGRPPEVKYALGTAEVMRLLPGAARQDGILYQDIIAVIALAAKERQQRLDDSQAAEAQDEARIRQQDGLIQALERQVAMLHRLFMRLQLQNPLPPRSAGRTPIA